MIAAGESAATEAGRDAGRNAGPPLMPLPVAQDACAVPLLDSSSRPGYGQVAQPASGGTDPWNAALFWSVSERLRQPLDVVLPFIPPGPNKVSCVLLLPQI